MIRANSWIELEIDRAPIEGIFKQAAQFGSVWQAWTSNQLCIRLGFGDEIIQGVVECFPFNVEFTQ